MFWFGISIAKLGPFNWGPGGGVINLSRLISKTYGLTFSSTIHNVALLLILAGNGW